LRERTLGPVNFAFNVPKVSSSTLESLFGGSDFIDRDLPFWDGKRGAPLLGGPERPLRCWEILLRPRPSEFFEAANLD
jgi:hypothetical protein